MTQYLGLNISDELAEAIAARTAITQETKTEIVTTAIKKELGIQKNATLGDRVAFVEVELKDLKQQVQDIEARLDKA
jgi:hypothetical protein